jgi:hypothetical protein
MLSTLPTTASPPLSRPHVKRRFAEIEKSTFSAEPSVPAPVAPAASLQIDAAWKLLEQIDEERETPEQYNARQIAAHTHRLVDFQLYRAKPQKRHRRKRILKHQISAPDQLVAAAEHFGPGSACARLLAFVSSFEGIDRELFFQRSAVNLDHALCCPGESVYQNCLCRSHFKQHKILCQLARRECEK